MRQSFVDPKAWVSLDPNDATTPAAIAGVQANPEPPDFQGIEVFP
jgi:hypothetical protein